MEDSLTHYLPPIDLFQLYVPLSEKGAGGEALSIPSMEGMPLAETLQQQVWFTPLMFLLFVLYTFVWVRYSNVFWLDLKIFFNPSPGRLHSATVSEVSHARKLPMFLSVISVGLFAYFVRVHWVEGHSPESIGGLLFYLVALVGFYILFKIGVVRLMSFVFLDDEAYVKLRLSYDTVVILLSALLFVVDVFIAYSPFAEFSLYVGLFVCVLSVFLYLIKIFVVFFSGFLSLFYLILYLCTLEILPSAAFCLGLMGIV